MNAAATAGVVVSGLAGGVVGLTVVAAGVTAALTPDTARRLSHPPTPPSSSWRILQRAGVVEQRDESVSTTHKCSRVRTSARCPTVVHVAAMGGRLGLSCQPPPPPLTVPTTAAFSAPRSCVPLLSMIASDGRVAA